MKSVIRDTAGGVSQIPRSKITVQNHLLVTTAVTTALKSAYLCQTGVVESL
jgi:hypothetical protein